MKVYPNIELMEYKFFETVWRKTGQKPIMSNTEIFVFTQTWPNTGTAFASPGHMYGQSFTKEFTTVILNQDYDFAMVFFGGTLGYCLEALTDAFWDDLGSHKMNGVHDISAYR